MLWLQFYMKLEEKHQAMEEEKIQLEAKLKVVYLAVISLELNHVSLIPLIRSDCLVDLNLDAHLGIVFS
jgi:hypothetical protein